MTPSAVRPRDRGRWIPWGFVGFFVVVIAVNVTMVWYALGSFPGLVTDEAYKGGLTYNRNLAAAAAQDRLGWRADLQATMRSDKAVELAVRLADATGAPVDGASASARLERPAETADDLAVELESRGAGRYVGRIEVARLGVWDVHVVVQRGEDLFVTDQRVTLR